MSTSSPVVESVAEIPVLTDVLETGAVGSGAQFEQIPVLDNVLTSVDRQALELEVRETVLRSLQTRIDAVLASRLQETMVDVFSNYVHALQEDIKTELSATLQDVITRAVAQELSRVLAQKAQQSR